MKRVEWLKKNHPGFIGDQVFIANPGRGKGAWQRLNDYLLEEIDENMKTHSEIFEEWSRTYVKIKQKEYGAIIEKLIKERFNLDVKTTWKEHNAMEVKRYE